MAKYHINNQDGNIGVCKATQGKCPFGGDDNHFTSMSGAALAYEERMAAEQVPEPQAKPRPARHHVTWDDLSDSERALISKQDTALRDYYFELRDVSPKLTHQEVWNVVKEWDDHMMGVYDDQDAVLDSYYENEGNLGTEGYTNSYDAKVRWLKRVAGTEYPLLEDI